jgi:hypothetical protein
MLTRRRPSRIHHAAFDPHLGSHFQKTEQAFKIHAHRRAGVKGDGFPESLIHDFHQLAQADAVRIVGDKADDFVSMDGDGVVIEISEEWETGKIYLLPETKKQQSN